MVSDIEQESSAPLGRSGRRHYPHWPLSVRVAVITLVLSAIAITAVGGYLSTVIADGLYDQRRDLVFEQTELARSSLTRELRSSVGSSPGERQDSVAQFIQSLRTEEHGPLSSAALLPVDEESTMSTISTDRAVMDYVDPELRGQLSGSTGSIVHRNVKLKDGTPGMLTAVRISVPGSGSFDLVMLYSFAEEQNTLSFMRPVLLTGGAVIMLLLLGITIIIARMLKTPLGRVANAAERIADGDLDYRIDVRGGDELATVGTSFNRMAESLQEKITDLTELSHVQHRFVSDVSHELRTPLTTIKMAASVLDAEKDSFSPTIRRTTQLLTDQVNRFDHMLADLLEISRHDAGAAILDEREENLSDVARSTVELLKPIADEADSAFCVKWHKEPILLQMDFRRMERIVRNLLVNALEHAEGGPVAVETASNEKCAAIIVQDFGVGISEESARHVFSRFWRADPARSRTLGGAGLGLSIAAEDAHLHGAWLEAWGQEGRGAVFRLTLPKTPDASVDDSPLALRRSWELPDDGEWVGTPREIG
ncbi:MtrAB system histidine kinase MtrB [Helcobacillus massiliensis]|uniref:MtrAB system histidine kinase MtrB n=1 Tax=Helcobacillus massiliensis TaxID=521392 RepID=UPI0025551F71|nr:MtrAB system histidine kinase MtrB [Helcobacillus massiliensis]MDK7742252.1 MtrAB system histidine kinase MtrB [Helcobacillus massiliensis]WOO93505.1 MtrAB system histidine kinase MtrB [Helcobacillus massiliensis]